MQNGYGNDNYQLYRIFKCYILFYFLIVCRMLYFDNLADKYNAQWLCQIQGAKSKNDEKIICVSDKESKQGKLQIIEKDAKIVPVVDPVSRQVFYIAGPSGSGKSHYAAEIIAVYKKLFPNNEVYVFCRDTQDPVIDKLGVTRVVINEEIYTDPIDITQGMDDCLILFDDCDTIGDKKIKAAVDHLKNDIMEVGRKRNIYIIITSHLINKGHETKTVLNECHQLTLFPKAGSTYQSKYVLEKYVGLNKKQIDYLLKLPSRWVTIKRTYPQVCFYQHGCFMLNEI